MLYFGDVVFERLSWSEGFVEKVWELIFVDW